MRRWLFYVTFQALAVYQKYVDLRKSKKALGRNLAGKINEVMH